MGGDDPLLLGVEEELLFDQYHTRKQTYTHTHTQAHAHSLTRTHRLTYAHTHTHTDTHTGTHRYTLVFDPWLLSHQKDTQA